MNAVREGRAYRRLASEDVEDLGYVVGGASACAFRFCFGWTQLRLVFRDLSVLCLGRCKWVKVSEPH